MAGAQATDSDRKLRSPQSLLEITTISNESATSSPVQLYRRGRDQGAGVDTLGRRVAWLWWSVLIRRNKRAQVGWDRLTPVFARRIPQPRILHPCPDARYDAIHPSIGTRVSLNPASSESYDVLIGKQIRIRALRDWQ
jgi:hypothetical protein